MLSRMKSLLIFLTIALYSTSTFSQANITKKISKYKYEDFKALSINDTSDAVIDLFFSKKEKAIYNKMSLLPFSIILVAVPSPAQVVGLGSFIISGPLFLSGAHNLIRYRKRKLHHVLIEYDRSKELPHWVRKKVNKLLEEYSLQQINY